MANHHDEGMSRWTSFAECARYTGKQSTSDAAEFGTRSHAALEALIKGETLPPCADDEREAAEWAYNYITGYVGTAAEIHSETRVTIGEGHGPLTGIFGTCDIWFVLDGQLFVADFKSLGYSNRDHRPQLMGYAIALADGLALKTRTVIGLILHGGSKYVSRYEFDLDEAERWCTDIISAHRAATDETACPGNSCQYCGHYPCGAVTTSLAVVEKHWAAPSLAEKMNLAKLCEAYAKAVTAEVRTVLDAGGEVYDANTGTRYELADRAGAAPLADLEGLAKFMVGEVGIPRDEFIGMVSVSKTALIERLIKANAEAVRADPKTPVVNKKAASAMIARFFGEPKKLKVIKNTTNKKGN